MISIINSLPGNTNITLLSIALVCFTIYSSHTTPTTTHIDDSLLLDLLLGLSLIAYSPLILIKGYGYCKLIVRSHVTHTTSITRLRSKNRKENIRYKWLYNSEFLLCLTIFQFTITFGFIALNLLSLYTTSSTPLHTPIQPLYPISNTEPSKTINYHLKPKPAISTSSLLNLNQNESIPLLFQSTHLFILLVELLSFWLIILEIRNSPIYSNLTTINKSLIGLLEKDINELIKFKQDSQNLKSKSKSTSYSSTNTNTTPKWLSETKRIPSFGQSSTINYTSPIKTNNLNYNNDHEDNGDGTPRRRSRTSSSSINLNLVTPSSVPLARSNENQNLLDDDDNIPSSVDVRFTDPFNLRRSSNARNSVGNRRLSVRFDLTQHLNNQHEMVRSPNRDKPINIKPVITPNNDNYGYNEKEDYFTSTHKHTVNNEYIRPIPLSIIKSPKDTTINFSPSSNGSEILEDIKEEEYEDHDIALQNYGNNEINQAWMDVRGEQSV
ncbi:uncharacterized protein L201_006192 [Kwoniella dendrophila CBS 6074]|uniref:Uncharacterized protein n=1 Tax=Kwoniella dendrophila CBS 6074 TaxID=1295534 RepID=A0AAX4K238_9TREE